EPAHRLGDTRLERSSAPVAAALPRQVVREEEDGRGAGQVVYGAHRLAVPEADAGAVAQARAEMAMDAPEHGGIAGEVDEDCGRVARELADRVVRQDRVVVSRPSDERP